MRFLFLCARAHRAIRSSGAPAVGGALTSALSARRFLAARGGSLAFPGSAFACTSRDILQSYGFLCREVKSDKCYGLSVAQITTQCCALRRSHRPNGSIRFCRPPVPLFNGGLFSSFVGGSGVRRKAYGSKGMDR